MLNRRNFLSIGAAGFAGLMTATPGSGQLSTEEEGDYRAVAFRWWGGDLRVIDRASVRAGDFLVFAPMRDGGVAGELDLFICSPAPPGDVRDSMLMSLGRHEDLDAVRVRMARYIEQLVGEFRRQRKLVFPRPAA